MLLQVLEGTQAIASVAQNNDNPIVALLTGLLLLALGALGILFYKYDVLNREVRETRLKDQEISMAMNNLLDKSIEGGTRNSDNVIKALETAQTAIIHRIELLRGTPQHHD